MKHFGIALVSSLALLACTEKEPTAEPTVEMAQKSDKNADGPAMDFDSRMLQVSQEYFALRPEIATYYGIPDDKAGRGISSRLGDYSPAGEAQRREGMKAILDELQSIEESEQTSSQQVSLGLIATGVRNAYTPATVVDYGAILGDYGVWFSPYAVSHLTGPHVEIPSILEANMAVRTRLDAMAYLTRLNNYAGVLNDVIAKMESDRELGVMPPDFSIRRTIENLAGNIAAPAAENSLVTTFNRKLNEAGLERTNEFMEQAIALVDEQVYPATRRLISALEAMLPLASHDAGVGHLPNGRALYQAMITQMTDTMLPPGDIHAIGLVEVDRIHLEMDHLLQSIGYIEGTVGARMSELLQDPQYIYPNTPEGKAELMAGLAADLERANAKLPQWFGKLPEQEVAIRAVPPHREKSTSGAFYDAPSMDGTRPGTFWIVLADTAVLPSYSLQTLTYHETNPGHHLQTMLGLDPSLPILNTIFYSNAAGEGWGLYAEYLASEMGLYENDPVDDLGRLQQELHRAVRLVVDTGMHAMSWSREQAIEYSVATEGIHVDEATAEIERYAVWPGQALGYKLGMLKILELRKRAQEQLGDRFDIRIFHDQVLENGAVPLNLLEKKIDAWIAAQG
ncbi:MAG: DUF885 domain-containing protein [Gammaproteobacteria bacterium]|nr:DUF885 domain-containing protein [Gammaproteobacteria bacterium]